MTIFKRAIRNFYVARKYVMEISRLDSCVRLPGFTNPQSVP